MAAHNYSDALVTALRAVTEMNNPNYLLLPIDPDDEMLQAGSIAAGISEIEARDVYHAMILHWVSNLPH
jgi:hypothetical protein